jgi:DNA repair exonuclease SbcCD ATPase subunit
MSLALILGIVGVLAGAALTYWLMQQKLEEQKQDYLEQSRQLQNNLESRHESRMQETIKSLQIDYDNQLTKTKEQLEAAHQSQMQATIESLQTDYQNQLKELETAHESRMQAAIQSQLTRNTEELETAHQSQMQATIESWQTQYQNQIKDLEAAHELQLQETIKTLEAKYQSQLQQAQGLLDSAPQTPPIQYDSPVPVDAKQEVVISPVKAEEVKSAAPSNTAKQYYQELSEKILAWGENGASMYISPLIELVYNSDSYIRQSVASALGKITAYKTSKSDLDRVIPVLGKLTKDPAASVRQSAVEALGKIKSERVIPFIQNALRDSDRHVVKSASAALNQVKFYRVSQVSKAAKTQRKQ